MRQVFSTRGKGDQYLYSDVTVCSEGDGTIKVRICNLNCDLVTCVF